MIEIPMIQHNNNLLIGQLPLLNRNLEWGIPDYQQSIHMFADLFLPIFKLFSMDQQSLFLLEIAEQCQRYNDMVKIFKTAPITQPFTQQQRSLFSTTYKNILSSKRTAWRAIAAFETKLLNQKAEPQMLQTIKWYKSKIQKQIKDNCTDALHMAEQLIKVSSKESQIFYYRMRGDYFRYSCEITKDAELKLNQQKAIEAYEEAEKVSCSTSIRKSDPLLLGVCLNLSVFYYQILGDINKAIEVCEKGFNGASDKLNDIEDDEFKDTTTIMQLMYDNLMQWKQELKV